LENQVSLETMSVETRIVAADAAPAAAVAAHASAARILGIAFTVTPPWM
jgi:hypothetical protein